MSKKESKIQKDQFRVEEDKQVPITSYKRDWLKVDSFDELMEHEKEIVARIAQTRNGGNLFMAHPLRLLADIGVELSDKAQKELISRESRLASLSELPYEALRKSAEKQSIRFHMLGLFHDLFERRPL